jgi:hypothetical protein
LDGRITFADSLICVDDAQGAQGTMLVILHELEHAMFTHAGIKMPEEGAIDALAYQLLGLIRDNPDLIRAILRLRMD